VVCGLAGVFGVPCGCMGVNAQTPLSAMGVLGFMFGLLLAGEAVP